MAGGECRDQSPGTSNAPGRDGMDEECRLGIVGSRELVFGSFPGHARKGKPEDLVGFDKRFPRFRESLRELSSHADLLRSLSGKEKREAHACEPALTAAMLPRPSVRRAADQAALGFHSITAAPQVTPPPKATSSTRSRSLTRPVRTASSSRIGTEAAEVLP